MANPADNLMQVEKNFFSASNRSMIARMDSLIRFIEGRRIQDAIVKSLDVNSSDKYVIDIYEQGFGSAPTQLDVDCYAVDNWEEFKVGWPIKVVLKDSAAYAVSGLHFNYFKPTSYAINKIVGKPCDRDGVVDASITNNININFVFPFAAYTNIPKEQEIWIWVRYPRPLDCNGSFDSAGVVIFGAGGFEPKWGKLKTAWPEFSDHNQVTLVPCVSSTSGTATGEADVLAYIQTPLDSTPYFFAVNVDKIVGYFYDQNGNAILLHCPIPGSDTLYDVIQIGLILHGKGVGLVGSLKAQ